MTKVLINVIFLCAVVVGATWTARSSYLNGFNDFLSFHAGAKLAFSDRLYDPETVADVQNRTAGTAGPALRFVRLPHYAVLLSPLSLLPYYPAYILWQLLNVAAVAAAVWLWPYSRQTFGFVTSVCVPLYWSFLSGQDVGILLFFVVLTIRSMSSLSLVGCLAKFHFFWLIPAAIPRAVLIRAGVASTALLLIPLVWNPTWPVTYYSTVIGRRDVISNTPISLFPWLGLYGLPIAALAGVWITRQCSREMALSACVAIAVLVSPHAYFQDYALLVPLASLLWERSVNLKLHFAQSRRVCCRAIQSSSR